MKYDFGVFGGDMRQAFIGKMLKSAGYSVLYYGVSEAEEVSSFAEFLECAEILLGPIPLSRDQKQVSGKIKKQDMTLDHLEAALDQGRTLIAGCIPARFTDKQYRQYDYMLDEALTVFNSIATAEGALVRAIEEGTGNISGSRCMIIGYGVCAKTLASRLQGLKADVIVCARRKEIRMQAEAEGHQVTDFKTMTQYLKTTDYVFNTVPALVLQNKELKEMQQDAVIIDIASAPGGVEFEAAKELGIAAFLCPGLPGIYAPKASAAAMVKMVLEIREEQRRK